MEELEKIMECRRTISQRVIPVFYEVDPSDVFMQEGAFGEGFEDKLISWRAALSEANNILGLHSVDSSHHLLFSITFYRREHDEINKVVEDVMEDVKADLLAFRQSKDLVGIESRVQDVVRLLNSQQSQHPQILGIWGMAGIGKTTIAKEVFSRIGHGFEALVFLNNVRECTLEHGLLSLQHKLLSTIFETEELQLHSIESAKKILRERLHDRKILVILDDVNEPEQLNALCGSRDWFSSGSVIIVTTRDRRLLKTLGVDHVYRVPELDQIESLELFCWRAFSQASPGEDFVELSRKVVAYSGGLPLALKVTGRTVFGSDASEWKSLLPKLKRDLDHKLYRVLKSCFDDLDETAKVVGLDIACFYSGMDRNEVIQMYAFSAEVALQVLQDQSLLIINENNKLRMHVLLQHAGREFQKEKVLQKVALGKIYDVFLSFRGKDSRPKFVSHLHTSLENAGIYVFRDDDEIRRGDTISDSLLRSLRQSRICIVVLSKHYANSKWCMLELENIMEYRQTMGLVVVPVFYEVDPSDVRHQAGEFGKAFEDLITRTSLDEEDDTVQNCRTALLQVGGIAGVVIINSRNESEDVKKVVEDVTDLLGKTDLFVAEHPVGVEARIQDVIQLLHSHQSKAPLLLGIWGMGGLGKTTIVKAVYNQIRRDFEAKSFLLNVREVCEQNNGIVSLQQKLLSDIYKTTKIKIDNVESGRVELKRRLSQKKIFLVLDDVNRLDQLASLCGSCEWFGQGSRIIITTRDENIVSRAFGVELVYRIKEMDEKESLELFSWHAFKQPIPGEGYADLSRDVVEYCGGLPLALQVIGSFLLTRRRTTEWKNVLEKLKVIPNGEVMEKLKISFDGLSDDDIKEIFLHLAFFFIGMDQHDVIKILKDCEHFAEIGISVLVQQSLVTIDRKNRIGMHDLLRDMGREIVRKKSVDGGKEPSRLWHYQDLDFVLSKDTRKTDVQGLTLKSPEMDTTYNFEAKAFEKMDKLRLLQLAGVKIDGDYKYLSKDLRWLCWHRFPLKYTPTDFHQQSLVAIDFKYSNLEQVWKKSQLLKKLKFLNLSHSPNLRQTPDFSNLPNLEKLVLKDCSSLSSISHTIGNLNELVLLNLKNCTSLHSLPKSIYKLKSLKTLILSGCSKIDKLEEDIEQMESLTILVADNTAITRVPFAVVRSKSIGYISLCGYEGFSRDVFPSIIRSWMSPTNNILFQVQTSSMGMSSLDILYEQNSSSSGLFYALKDLQKLRRLWVKCDSEVQLNECVERILDALKITNCAELEATPSTSQVSNNSSALLDCHNQVRISGSKLSSTSLLIQMGMNCRVFNTLKETILQMSPIESGLLPSDDYPDWLTFNSDCSSVTFEVPQVDGRNLRTIMFIVYSSSPDNITSEGLKNVLMINCTKNTIQLYKKGALGSFNEEEWQKVVSNIEPGNKVKVVVFFEKEFIVKKTSVYLIYDVPTDQKTEHCHEPDKSVPVSGGDENDFSQPEGSNADPPPCLKKKKIKHKDTQKPIPNDIVEKFPEIPGGEAVYVYREADRNVPPETQGPQIPPSGIPTRTNIEVPSPPIENPLKEAAVSENEPLQNPFPKIVNPSGPTSEAQILDTLNEPTVQQQESPPCPSLNIKDYEKMLEDDPFQLMMKIISKEIHFSDTKQISTKTSESSTSTPLPMLINQLKELIFSVDLIEALPSNTFLSNQIRKVMDEIEVHQDKLKAYRDIGVGNFCYWYNDLTSTIDQIKNSKLFIFQLEADQEEIRQKLMKTRSKYDGAIAAVLMGASRRCEIKNEIQSLKQQISELEKEDALIIEEELKCEDQKRNIIEEIKVLSKEALEKGKETAALQKKKKKHESVLEALRKTYEEMKFKQTF
ncbi:disease resistance protein RPV1-like isoform X3 [Lotus japonicus]|nr:disease resistance protein RPV1-like isoform X3 [Lotus japonicus]XP_057436799.1 disease resistance protein RPV1-like isoform X3 [Lotus japonicus]